MVGSGWTPGGLSVIFQPVLALSIRQPWAWLIVAGHKDIENRSWPTKVRGRFLIHAATYQPRDSEIAAIERAIRDSGLSITIPRSLLRFGGIIGSAELVDCVQRSRSKWFSGRGHGFVLAHAKAEKFRPCRGQLGFFEPDFPTKSFDKARKSPPVVIPVIRQPELL